MNPSVAIINFGTGNLFSVRSSLVKISGEKSVVVTDDPKVIAKAGRIVLPGQGNAGSCLRLLSNNEALRVGLCEALRTKPVLGICVGQHLLGLRSEESETKGLGFLSFDTSRLRSPSKIPHIGWSAVWYDKPHPLLRGIPMAAKFYFAHSYCVRPNQRHLSAFSFYGSNMVTAIVIQDNIVTTQFHPEKSSRFGFVVLRNFLRWKP